MKILFLTDNFPPEVNAPATRTIEHILEWEKSGVETTVITCAPNFPDGILKDGYKNKFPFSREEFEGIKVIRCWTYISKNEGSFKRILDYLSFAIMSTIVSARIPTDVIIATSPQFFTAVSGYVLSVIKRRPWVFELRDLWPDTIKAVGAIRSNSILRFLEWLEIFLYRKSSKIISVTDSFKTNLISRGIPEKKISVVTNGVDLTKFQNAKITNGKRLSGDRIKSIYIGTHGLCHNLHVLFKDFSSYSSDKMTFHFVGDGAGKEEFSKVVANQKLKNVMLSESVPKHKVANLLGEADVALVPLANDDNFKSVIPSKIFECCAMGLPIILGVEGESKRLIEKYEAGLCFEPDNGTDMLDKMRLLANDKEKYAELSQNAMKLAVDYSRPVLARRMLKEIEKIV